MTTFETELCRPTAGGGVQDNEEVTIAPPNLGRDAIPLYSTSEI